MKLVVVSAWSIEYLWNSVPIQPVCWNFTEITVWLQPAVAVSTCCLWRLLIYPR